MLAKGAIGSEVTQLQNRLAEVGLIIEKTAVFDDATEAALKGFQRRAGLVVDGIAGPKTIQALIARQKDPRHLSESDLKRAADRLGIQVAAIKAVNEVESAGRGFLDDGRPVILYERHKAFALLGESGMPYADVVALATRYPNLINEKRGGYIGKAGEWSRVNSARQIIPSAIVLAACSWGQFQIMGYHWQHLGYESIDAFVAAMTKSESDQLDAFVRFIESDPALIKALKARKWADFAKAYNGPAYKSNAYDARLAAAYARHAEDETEDKE